ncbi:unnamed protein product [Arctia plantaginis]|uniref:Prostaglandin reductase 1 n=1 Tax=Arctia plantaginis TaxID=874455 RepID=A0A8S0YW40_ARCPL|nr:unnamed protein product [Arctia plantaginis]
MVKARKYVVTKNFQGLPKRDDFEIVEYETKPLQNGEILVKAEWVSVDPYLRAYHGRYPVPYDQFGFQVGLVEESKDPRFPVGTRVVSHKGWCDYTVINTTKPGNNPAERVYKLPTLKDLSNSLGIGAVGMPGATAYFGFLELCSPKAGETVVVTGAAGAVGSLVGQIAKIKGCKVIGFAGSDEKVKWLEEIGFDKGINYKTADISASLKAAAPDGVDIYFDNVGGEISSLIINQMRDYGRVAVCGSISSYNEDPTKLPKASILQPSLVFRQLKIEGFLVWRWLDRWSEAFSEIIKMINSGELKPREHVTEGFDKIYDAFVGMLNGENAGKAVVKI